ncbi:hypothetical protein SteCoe_1482 [Stentor coeruleus]|uniref:TNFR-Cys domain-containing protein n=1 Tax=Stentor coeruleus TaxID=5963 RepID=A0A1R2D216_9CILI|nr:hypothetical protein SteCoe_1482 [Stentor coeruleus]
MDFRRLLFVLFITLTSVDSSCCLNCQTITGGVCTTCSSGYKLYNSIICLADCPSGYTEISGSCVQTSSLVLINEGFSSYTDWSVSSLTTLRTYSGETLNSASKTALIPTKTQGFYSTATSKLIGITNWIPSPDLTFNMWVLVKSDGHILEMTKTSSVNIRIDSLSSNYRVIFYILSQTSGLYTGMTQVLCPCNYVWDNVIVKITQDTSENVKITGILNGVSYFYTYSGYESRYQAPYNWYVGCAFSYSFQGFIYNVLIVNSDDSTTLPSFSTTSCDYNYYWDGNICQQCSASCSTWPWCISGSTCSPCYDVNCASCTGFDMSECYCGNSEVYPNCCHVGCNTCGGFWSCSACDSGYNLIDTICLNYCPSGSCSTLPSSSIIDITFNVFSGDYSGFTTGSDPNTYFFFHNPDITDPLPSYQRGLYLIPGEYLENSLLNLAFTFSIGMWVFPTSGTILTKGTLLSISTDTSLTIELLDKTQSPISYTTTSTSVSSWTYFSYTIQFITDTTTITVYLNNLQHFSSSHINSIFIDSTSSFILGNLYTGFIYTLKLWNTQISSFLTEYSDTICGIGLISSCLISCDYNEYYTNSCHHCPNHCDYGCRIQKSCNPCNDLLCAVCGSFISLCDQCCDHASGNPCSCDIGYYPNVDECLICHVSCSECIEEGVFGCILCAEGYFLWENILCIEECPSGYGGEDCVLEVQLVVEGIFDNLYIGEVDGFRIGSNFRNVYPIFDNNDPFPAKFRGLYFTSGKYLALNTVLAPHFSMNFWIKVLSPGVLLLKNLVMTVIVGENSSIQCILANYDTITVNFHMTISLWTYLSISISLTSINIYTDNVQISSFALVTPFIDNSQNQIFISNPDSDFEGFVFSIHIYNQADIHDYFFNNTCPYIDFCLSECSFTEDPKENCTSCKNSCENGCYDTRCSLCNDKGCYKCPLYDYCITCIEYAEMVDGKCICKDKYYYNKELETCESCPENCHKCVDNICYMCEDGYDLNGTSCQKCPIKCLTCNVTCITCIENAYLYNDLCECGLNFYGPNCNASTLTATMNWYGTEALLIYFSDPLTADLAFSDIIINIQNINFAWNLEKLDSQKYLIHIEINSPHDASNISLSFIKLIYSTKNAELITLNLYVELKESSDNKDFKATKSMEEVYSAVAKYAIAVITAISMMNPNPAALWSFINTVQLICFASLSSVPITPETGGILEGLRSYYLFPNIISYFYNGGYPHNKPQATRLGFENSSIILNNGKQITAFMFFLLYYGIMFLLAKIKWKWNFIREFIKETIIEFKWGFFIRFAIHNFLECCVSCFLAIMSPKVWDLDFSINFAVAGVFLTILILTPLLCFFIIRRNKRKVTENVDEYKNLYGTLFYEFNTDENLASSNFYIYFFLRRLAYCAILFLLSDIAILQMSLSITISLANLFYLLFAIPFSEKILNYSNIFSELGISVFFVIYSMLLFDISSSNKNIIDWALKVIINTMMAVQMIASIGLTGKFIYTKVKERKNRQQITGKFIYTKVKERKNRQQRIFSEGVSSKDCDERSPKPIFVSECVSVINSHALFEDDYMIKPPSASMMLDETSYLHKSS